MKLTPSQLEMIRAVRDRMTLYKPSTHSETYICWNLLVVATGSTDCLWKVEHLGKQMAEAGVDVVMLWMAIETALEGDGTMDNYVARVLRRGVEIWRQNTYLWSSYAALARLAWLDKILETGEIA